MRPKRQDLNPPRSLASCPRSLRYLGQIGFHFPKSSQGHLEDTEPHCTSFLPMLLCSMLLSFPAHPLADAPRGPLQSQPSPQHYCGICLAMLCSSHPMDPHGHMSQQHWSQGERELEEPSFHQPKLSGREFAICCCNSELVWGGSGGLLCGGGGGGGGREMAALRRGEQPAGFC